MRRIEYRGLGIRIRHFIYEYRNLILYPIPLLIAFITNIDDLEGWLVLHFSNIFLQILPGLLICTIVIQALRGNFLGAMASRIGSDIHLQNFRFRFRIGETLIDQSIITMMSILFSIPLVILATYVVQLVTHDFVLDLVRTTFLLFIAMIPSTLLLLVICVIASIISFSYEWDVDNFLIPLLTSLGDVISCGTFIVMFFIIEQLNISVPHQLLWDEMFLSILGVLIFAIFVCYIFGWYRGTFYESLISIMIQGWAILLPCLVLEVLAGTCLTHLQDMYFVAFPVLYIFFNAFLEGANAIAGVMCSRYVSKIHQGDIVPFQIGRRSLREFLMSFILMIEIQFTVLIIAVASKMNLPTSTSSIFAWEHYLWILIVVSLICFISTILLTIELIVIMLILIRFIHRFGLSLDACVYPLLSSSTDVLGAVTLTFVAVFFLTVLL